MEQGEIIFRTPMVKGRGEGFKSRILVYLLSGVVGLAFGAGLFYMTVINSYTAFLIATGVLASLVIILLALIALAFRLSAKEAIIYPDRLVLRMRLGRMIIPIPLIEEIKTLEPADAKRYFYCFSALNLTMSSRNAVMIRRKKGISYIINPELRDEFLDALEKLFPAESSLN
jgi:hypothetical protein